MKKAEAIKIAREFVAHHESIKKKNRTQSYSFSLEYEGISEGTEGAWDVYFKIIDLNDPEAVVDPGVLVVVEPDGRARFLSGEDS